MTIVAVGCETEPVSKNDEFQAFAERVLDAVDERGPEAANELEDERVELIGKLGENIVVAGAERYEAAAGETLGAYAHPPANKIGVARQARRRLDRARAAARDAHLVRGARVDDSKDDVPAEVVEAERQIYLNSDELEGKPEQAKEKIVEGMLASASSLRSRAGR